jgi:hypothetical protein
LKLRGSVSVSAHAAIRALLERSEMVGAEAVLAVAAIDELVVKGGNVARSDPRAADA